MLIAERRKLRNRELLTAGARNALPVETRAAGLRSRTSRIALERGGATVGCRRVSC